MRVKIFLTILLVLLLSNSTACISEKIVYVYPTIPDIPQKPSYYPSDWKYLGGYYCVDEKYEKNLRKNREIDKYYEKDLLTVIETIRKQAKDKK